MKPIVVKAADADSIARHWGDLRHVDRLRGGEVVVLDVSALTGVTAAFEAFFVALDRHVAARAARLESVDPNGLLAPIRARYDFNAYDGAAPARRRHRPFLVAVGQGVCNWCASARANCTFLGETFANALSMIIHPRRFRFRDASLAFERAGFDGLPITTAIGFLLGLILAFESAASLRTFGVEVYVALAGRSGSAFAAEIGTMKVDEELDALTTFGLPPVRFLVMPRVVAATLAMPVLTIFAELAGLLGGSIVLQLMRVPPVVYWSHVTSAASLFMILFGLGKAALFGFLVGLIGCSAGMRTRNTADGVGVAATAAVVGGIVAIAVTDGLLAVVCYLLGV